MLRAAGRRLIQWKGVEQGAKAVLFPPTCIRDPYTSTRFWKCSRAFSSYATTDFQGLYSSLNIELDEPTTQLWNRIESQYKEKKSLDIIKEWKNEGNNLLTEELLCNITYKLCTRTLFRHAAKVTDWLRDNGNEPKSDFYKLMRLDVLSREASAHIARLYFDKELTNKSETAYLMLLRGYTVDASVQHAEELFGEMKQAKVMTNGRAYMYMMKMYINAGNGEMAIDIFKQFEESGLPPNLDMYCELFKHRVTIFRFIPVEQKAEEALSKTVMDNMNRRDVLRINALLGKAEEVDRVWNEMKGSHHVGEAVVAVGCYAMLGDLAKVEEISRELQVTKKAVMDHYLVMVRIYAKRGDIEKALEWKDKIVASGHQLNFESTHPLVMAYLRKGDVEKAVEVFMDEARRVNSPYSLMEECVIKFNEEFAKRKDVKSAEDVMTRVKKHHTVHMYESLIKVYLSANEAPKNSIKRRMQQKELSMNGADIKELLQQLCGVPGYKEEGDEDNNVKEGTMKSESKAEGKEGKGKTKRGGAKAKAWKVTKSAASTADTGA